MVLDSPQCGNEMGALSSGSLALALTRTQLSLCGVTGPGKDKQNDERQR